MKSSKTKSADHGRSLSEAINIATRAPHAKLNKLIIARLPLALPPLAPDPSIYVTGLLHIAPIYVAFESLWKALLQSGGSQNQRNCRPDSAVPNSNVGPSHNVDANIPKAILELLRQLFLPDLLRSEPILSDIRTLTGWSSSVLDEQLKIITEHSKLGEFVSHIERAIEHRPHIILSYAYILFMALFAGGRFIRSTLESIADTGFWERKPSAVLSTSDKPLSLREKSQHLASKRQQNPGHSLPLAFFRFPAPSDGEALKQEFKKQFSSAELNLSPHQRHDIVQEAVCIFDNMLSVVVELDGVCGTDFSSDARIEARKDSISISPSLFGARPRDSVAVAKERRDLGKSASSNDSHSNSAAMHHVHHKCSLHGGHNNTAHVGKGVSYAATDKAQNYSSSHPRPSSGDSKTQREDEDGDGESCALLGKSVRFGPESKSCRRFFSTDGTLSRRESSESVQISEGGHTKGQAYLPLHSSVVTAGLPNFVLMAAVTAFIGIFYFVRNAWEEDPS